jgi:hypothetical protein
MLERIAWFFRPDRSGKIVAIELQFFILGGMMGTRNAKVPPFIDEEAERIIQKTRQSVASYVVMAFGWLGLTVALVGGAFLIYSYLTRDPKAEYNPITAPLIILALTYLTGWVVSLVSIRRFYNLVMPLVIKVYSFGVLAGFLFVYSRAIYKIFIFQQADSPDLLPSFPKYFAVLLVGYLLLVSLDLLLKEFYLVPHAIILLVAIFIHLVAGVYHYVFTEVAVPQGLVSYDVYFLLTVLFIAFLLTRRRLYAPARRWLARMFRPAASR